MPACSLSACVRACCGPSRVGLTLSFFYFLFCCFGFSFYVILFLFLRALCVCVRAHLLAYVHACLLSARVRVCCITARVVLTLSFFILLFCCFVLFFVYFMLFVVFVCVRVRCAYERTCLCASMSDCSLPECVVCCRVVSCRDIVSPHRAISSRVMPFAWRVVCCRVTCHVVPCRVISCCTTAAASFTCIHTCPNLPAFTWNFINIYKLIYIHV